MRYVFGFICVLALSVVSATGCGDECMGSLSDYCSGADCPTYEETVADSRWYSDEVRACEDTRLILGERTFETGSVRYFDDSGTLVAAERFNWNPGVKCRTTLYGPVPSCPEVQQGWRW